MSAALALREPPIARFRAVARPRLLGPGDWGTERYRFGGLEVWARVPPSGRSGVLYLYWVGAVRPGQGEGAAGMRLLTAAADQARLMLMLHADPSGAQAMQRDTLRAWYERFGFVATCGGSFLTGPAGSGSRCIGGAPGAAHRPPRLTKVKAVASLEAQTSCPMMATRIRPPGRETGLDPAPTVSALAAKVPHAGWRQAVASGGLPRRGLAKVPNLRR